MRLIDADKLEYQMLYKENFLKGSGHEAQAIWKEDIDSQPTIDAVPVVRCKDCKYHGANECTHSFALIVSKDNDFCSYAERRIDE